MAYTDQDMRVATQLAYIDFNPEHIAAHPEWTVRDHIINTPGLKEFIEKEQPGMLTRYMNENYGNWKILEPVNNNSLFGSGFCACTIDTGDGNAIIGYRGSESSTLEIGLDDWVFTDVGFLNSKEQRQQTEAAEYMQMIYEKYGDDYNSFSATGHSLGGNLAEHATLMSSDEMAAKLDRVVSFDGPGYSDEYIATHAEQIERRASLIDHFQYSFVGVMLNPIPGTNYRTIAAHDDQTSFFKDPLRYFMRGFWRHGTWNIEFDKEGYVQDGEPDDLAIFFRGFSNAADDLTSGPWYMAVPQLASILLGINEEVSPEEFWNTVKKYQSEYLAPFGKIPCNFKISTPKLDSTSDTAGSVARNLPSEAAEVKNIKSEVSLLLKAASLFTVSYKLGKSASNLEKLAKKAQKVMEVGKEASSSYSNTERELTSNAGA
ncbi:MAG: DUF2974 domain-containing protein [Clostridia bacterium]|nr:DUF2974 domain-containing protein [Clostridia bacterium]